MDPTSIMVGLVVGVALGVGVAWPIVQSFWVAKLAARQSQFDVVLASRDDRDAQLAAAIDDEKARSEQRAEEIKTGWMARYGDLQRQHAELRQDDQQRKETFQALASQTLQNSTRSFLQLADEQFKKHKQSASADLEQRQASIKATIDPLTKKQAELDVLIREFDSKRETSFAVLTQQALELRDETQRLAQTLANPTVRGGWGELHLKRVLELAGLTRYADFGEQVSAKIDGASVRMDVVINLPGKKQFVIDAKLPLNAFNQALSAPDDKQRAELFKAHVAAVKTQMEALSNKEYFKAVGSPEFVIMFIPVEAAYYAALQFGPELLDLGSQKYRVLLCGPMTLISLLKSVAFGWREVELYDNAKEISALGKNLFDRVRTVAKHAAEMGKDLKGFVESFNGFVGSLEGRVLGTARKLQELGAAEDGENIPPLDEVLEPIRLFDPDTVAIDDESRPQVENPNSGPAH